MICPHCSKPIEYGVSDQAAKRARELIKQGYSMRETERMLFKEGMHMSFSTISRMLRGERAKDSKKEAKKAGRMILVMYHPEQDAWRFYSCDFECWEDMIYFPPLRRKTALSLLMSWGWEVIGEF